MGDIIHITWRFTELSVNVKHSVFIILVLMVGAILIGRRFDAMNAADKPSKGLVVVIMLVSTLNNFIKEFYGRHWKTFAPLLLSILVYLVFANTASLWGLATPLSNINVALAFSLFAFLTIQFSALWIHKPLKRLKNLSSPTPFLLPLNLVGEISTPLAMGLRLFGNLLSGAVIGVLIYSLFGGSLIFGNIANVFLTTVLLHPVFNIFFGAIQAFVYFMLLTIFLSMAIEDSEPA